MPPRRQPTNATRSRPQTRVMSQDELADQFATKLAITSKTKGKSKATEHVSSETLEERRISIMRAVNTSSKKLSAVIESGWKATTTATNQKHSRNPSTATLGGVGEVVESLRKDIKLLRQLRPREVDIERATSSIVGKLLSLEMYTAALTVLSEMQQPLVSLYLPSYNPLDPSPQERLIVLPLPTQDSSLPEILLTLISTYLLHSIVALTHAISPSHTSSQPICGILCSSGSQTPTLLTWLPYIKNLPTKHLDSILTRAYTTLTKAWSSSNAYPTSIFQLRVYGLFCLAHTSPSVLEPTAFWEQVIKFTMNYVAANVIDKDPGRGRDDGGSAGPRQDGEVTNVVLHSFDELVGRTQERQGFMKGRGFVKFCEYWMSMARKAGNVDALERIAALGDSAPESTRLCAVLTKGTSALELFSIESSSTHSLSDEGKSSLLSVILTLPKCRQGLQLHTQEADAVNLKRAIERFRRAAVKIFDVIQDKEVKAALDGILELLEYTIREERKLNADLVSPALDTLITLARKIFVVSNPLSIDSAFDYLNRGESILMHPPSSEQPDNHIDIYECYARWNYVRVLSGAFYNLSGILYQAGRYAHAARFLEKACYLGSDCLAGFNTLKKDKGKPYEKDVEGWKTMQGQLYKRWEVLGVCHMKGGDRRPAFDAFIKAIRSYPFFKQASNDATQLIAEPSSSPRLLFEDSGSYKLVATLVDRITYLGVSELLLSPAEVSLKHYLSSGLLETGEVGDAINNLLIGALLERQVFSLQASLYKPDVRKAVRNLLDDALSVYDAESVPIRRSGILVLCLEVRYRDVEGGLQDGDVEDIGREVESLLSRENFARDVSLKHLRPQLSASLHLWLALHAHRNSIPDVVSPSLAQRVVHHSERVCEVVKEALSTAPAPRQSLSGLTRPRGSIGGGTSKIRSPAKGGGLGRTSKLPAAPRKKVAIKTRTPALTAGRSLTTSRIARLSRAPPPPAPVTPKSRKGLEPLSLNVAGITSPKATLSNHATLTLRNLCKLVDLFRMLAHLLGLLGQVVTKVHLLNVTRKLCDRFAEDRPEEFVQVSIDLAHEYVLLGKTERAANVYNRASNVVKTFKVSDETRVLFYLRYAELLGTTGNILKSSTVYCEARTLAESLDVEETGFSTIQMVKVRVGVYERAALASNTFAVIQHSKDDPTTSLSGLLQALRLWHRAVDALARLAPQRSIKTEPSNPFDMTELRDALPSTQPLSPKDTATKSFPARLVTDGLEWKVASGLLSTLFSLTQAYCARGSAREAEYFAQQALDFASSLNAPAMVGRSLTRLGEIQLKMGRIEESSKTLVMAADYVEGCAGVEKVELNRLGADVRLALRDKDGKKDGRVLYEEAMRMLEELEEVFTSVDGISAALSASTGLRRSLGASPKSPRVQVKNEALLPPLLVAVLRQNISLLHSEGEEYRVLLDRLQTLPSTVETKAEENSLMAKLTLDDAYARFRADMFLNSLTDSTITLPMGMTGECFSTSPTTKEILNTLNTAEKLFWSDLALVARRGNVSHVREAAISLALIRAFQTSLGKAGKDGPTLAARLLDASNAITLRREMIETIQHKFYHLRPHDDLQWPLITPNGSVLPVPSSPHPIKSGHGKHRLRSLSPTDEGSDEELEDDLTHTSTQTYWNFISEKYSAYHPSLSSFATSVTSTLPRNWTVCSITLTEDKNTLFITRQASQHDPLIFCVPLQGRRDAESDEAGGEGRLPFDGAVRELREIIRLSDEGARGAMAAAEGGKEARIRWWAERVELDKRMKLLLEDIEFCWLGAFKTILNEPTNLSQEVLTFFRSRLEKIFKRSLITQGRKQQRTRVRLSDTLLECFSTLSPQSRDEELEDLIYFILDLYQFHGIPVATAEVDITQVVVDIRTVLEELQVKIKFPQAKTSRSKATAKTKGENSVEKYSSNDHHTFLILDKNVQGLPWESIPVLRGRSVSRIPNIESLLDRVQWAKWQKEQKQDARSSGTLSKEDSNTGDRVVIDPRKTFFILNPSGDLKKTEGRFNEWLNEMRSVGWDGIIGCSPSEQQLVDALTRNDLLIYFGHGGAEQYIRTHKVRHLPRCSATMLWGCSSGALRDMGEFDRIGTPYNYMLAGCPTLVANLWDVTDRDIDKLSQSVFDKMKLTAQDVRSWGVNKSEKDDTQTSIVAAVAQSRDACKLKYLTGAAPVVYGIPFYM